VNIELSDIHIILGPARDFMSKEEDFSQDPKGCFYDCKDQLTNICMMHEIVEETRRDAKKLEKKKRMEDRGKRREQR
jgi:hypothetical protein